MSQFPGSASALRSRSNVISRACAMTQPEASTKLSPRARVTAGKETMGRILRSNDYSCAARFAAHERRVLLFLLPVFVRKGEHPDHSACRHGVGWFEPVR